MANVIIIKNSPVAGREPLASDLQYGEIAINYQDGKLFFKDPTNVVRSFVAEPDYGTVKSVDISGGATGLTFSGGPVTSSGTFLLDGILDVTHGGTGATTKEQALTNLLPSLSNITNKFLYTDGSTFSWQGLDPSLIIDGLGYTPVNKAGDSMAGFLILNADPQAELGAATKQYVDSVGTYISGVGIDITSKVVTNTGVTGLTAGTNISVSSATGNVTIGLTGTVSIANGGTGSSTPQEAINALSKPIGSSLTANTVLRSDGINVTLSKVNLTSDVIGALPVAYGGTGQTSFTTGYIRSNGITLSSFALIPGSDISGNIPGNAANVTGIVAIANGGTGQSSFEAGYIKSDGMNFVSSTTISGADVTGDISGNAANVTGVVAIANGGTGVTTQEEIVDLIIPAQTDNSGKYLTTDGTTLSWADAATGTVTSVDASGGTTGLSFTGGPVTSSGVLTLEGTLNVTNGGTGTTDGSITGTGTLTFTSGGTDSSIVLAPQGSGAIDVSSKRIVNLATPTQATDAVTKEYVDAVKTGLDVKDSVLVATTENITLSGLLTVDDVTLVVGSRVLVKNQTNATENGIYVVGESDWVRSSDADNTPSNEVTSGMFVFVEEGTVNKDSGWVLTTNDPITLGTTELSFAQFSGAGQITAGEGLSKTGNLLTVNVDDSSIEIVSDVLQVKDSGIAFSKIQDLVGLSVLGRSADTQGISSEISAAEDHTILRRNGSSLAFGSIDLSQLNTVGVSILSVANGGTGASTPEAALTALLPNQTDNSGYVLSTNGSVASWILPFSGSYNDLTDKPVLFDGQFSSLSGTPTTLLGYGITDTVVTSVNGILPPAGGGAVTLSSSDLTDGATLVKSVNAQTPDLNGAINLVLTNLGILEGTDGQVLTTNGSGVYTFTDTTVAASNITGVISIANGGTGQSSFAAGYIKSDGTSLTSVATVQGSDVTGDISGNANNVTGIVSLANGGTGISATDVANLFNQLVPVQTDNSGKYLTTDGTSVSWVNSTLNNLFDVNLTSLSDGEMIIWDSANTKWINISPSTLSVSAAVTATNVAGGDSNQILYNTATGVTGFIPTPTTPDAVLYWDGSAYVWGTVGDASAITTTGNVTTDADYYLAMTSANDGSAQALNTSAKLKYNPSTTELSAPIVKMENAQIASITYTSTNNFVDQQIDEVSVTDARTIRYTIQVTSGTDYQATEILMIHDGIDVYLTEFGSLTTNLSLCTFNADILSGQIRLLMTPVNSSTVIKAIRNVISA